jgi:hypothetical protein
MFLPLINIKTLTYLLIDAQHAAARKLLVAGCCCGCFILSAAAVTTREEGNVRSVYLMLIGGQQTSAPSSNFVEH